MRGVGAVLGVALAVRLAIAARWGLLADEAYHWTWSLSPALGYYDQPPLVAWVLWLATALLGDSPLALRCLPILAALGAVAALLPWARDRGLWLLWALGLPPLWLMTQLAVPDALLIAAWGGALAAALAGGRMWIVAGALAGAAALAKHTGLVLFPLLLLAADTSERRQPWPWVGLLASVAAAAPNLAWNASHDWVTFRFQLGEGLLSPSPPGWLGPLRQLGEQALFVTPLAFAAAVVWSLRRPSDRVERLCWASSVPVLVAFAVAAAGGPPEPHWTAPAWLGVGLGLSRTAGRLHRLAATGAWLALIASLALLVHSERPLVPLRLDPAAGLAEGGVLADGVARWALPTGVAPREAGARDAVPVVTERYQEAALVHYHTGIPATVLEGCGRPSQYTLDAAPPPATALFVRPARSGRPSCAEAVYPEVGPASAIRGHDRAGRPVGPWDVFEVGP